MWTVHPDHSGVLLQRFEAVDRTIGVEVSKERGSESDVGSDINDGPLALKAARSVDLVVVQPEEVGDIPEIVSNVQCPVDGIQREYLVRMVLGKSEADTEIFELVPQDPPLLTRCSPQRSGTRSKIAQAVQ